MSTILHGVTINLASISITSSHKDAIYPFQLPINDKCSFIQRASIQALIEQSLQLELYIYTIIHLSLPFMYHLTCCSISVCTIKRRYIYYTYIHLSLA